MTDEDPKDRRRRVRAVELSSLEDLLELLEGGNRTSVFDEMLRFMEIRGKRHPDALKELAAIQVALIDPGRDRIRDWETEAPAAHAAAKRYYTLVEAGLQGGYSLEELAAADKYDDLPKRVNEGERFDYTRSLLIRLATLGVESLADAPPPTPEEVAKSELTQFTVDEIREHFIGHKEDIKRNLRLYGEKPELWDESGTEAINCGMTALGKSLRDLESTANTLQVRMEVRRQFVKIEIPEVKGNA